MRNFLKEISVEPLLFSGMFIINFYSTISQQFIYQQVAESNGLFGDHDKTCNKFNQSDPVVKLEQKVSSETSLWILYLNVAGTIPSLFTSAVMSSWGDVVGRTMPLILIYGGFIFLIVVYIIVVNLKLPIAWLLAARLVCGLTGDFPAMVAVCFAYLSDLSKTEQRTLRIAVGEAMLGLAGLLAGITEGLWIGSQGFEQPLWLLLALSIVGFLYIIFFLRESRSIERSTNIRHDFRELFTWRPFLNIWGMLTLEKQRCYFLLSLLGCLFLHMVLYIGLDDVSIVYELSEPFCWSPNLIGYGQMIHSSTSIFGLVAFKLLYARLSDWWIFFMGMTSSICNLITFALSQYTWSLFVGLALGCFYTIPATVLRSMMSRMVTHDEQGAVFATIAAAQNISLLIASFIFNGIYSATVASFRGAIFVVGAFIGGALLSIFRFVYAKTLPRLSLAYQTVTEEI
ncbi:proton-coupled folate transporter [Ciona intestinalis]